MKLPRRINVVGHDYRFRLSSEADCGVGDGIDRIGAWNGGVSRITIRIGLSASQSRETVLHEILHALALHTQTPGLSERVIAQVCPALLDTLRRNKKLTEFLLDRS